MDDETKRLMGEFIAAANGLRQAAPSAVAQPPQKGVWKHLDFRLNVGTILTLSLLVGGAWLTLHDDIIDLQKDRNTMQADIKDVKQLLQLRDPSSLASKVDSALNSGSQNAAAILKEEQERRASDERLSDEIRTRIRDHITDQHGKRAGWPFDHTPTPPLMDAQAQPLPVLSPAPTPPLRDFSEPCCAPLLVSGTR